MLRKLMFVLAVLALPLVVSSAASAQDSDLQYPPSGEASTLPRDDSPAEVQQADPADPTVDSTPLARTGTDTGRLVAVGVVLLAGGALAVGASVATRRRGAPTPV